MKINGVLLKVFEDRNGYLTLDVEGLRISAGKADPAKVSELKAMEGKPVSAVVSAQWMRTRDGRNFVRHRLLSISLDGGGL